MTLVRPTWGSLPSISAAAGVVWRSSCSYSNVAVTLSPVYGLHILWPFYLSIIYMFDNTFSTNFIVLRTWMSVCVLFPLFLKKRGLVMIDILRWTIRTYSFTFSKDRKHTSKDGRPKTFISEVRIQKLD